MAKAYIKSEPREPGGARGATGVYMSADCHVVVVVGGGQDPALPLAIQFNARWTFPTE